MVRPAPRGDVTVPSGGWKRAGYGKGKVNRAPGFLACADQCEPDIWRMIAHPARDERDFGLEMGHVPKRRGRDHPRLGGEHCH